LKRYQKCLCNCYTYIYIVSCEIGKLERNHKCLLLRIFALWVVREKSWSDIKNDCLIVTQICVVTNCYTYLYCELWNRRAGVISEMLCNCYTYFALWVVKQKSSTRHHKCLWNCVTHIDVVSCDGETLKRCQKCLWNCYTYIDNVIMWVVKWKSWSDIKNVHVIVTHICVVTCDHIWIVSCEIEKLKQYKKCLCNCYTYLYTHLVK
jgi:hypothetical protein